MLFYEMIQEGGEIMWVILFCSLVSTFIFIERWFHFHREQINVGELVKGLINVLKRDGFIEAVSLCDNTPGPVARILMAAIQAYQKGDEDVRQAIEDAALTEVPRLERRLNVLGTIGYVAPLLGLLGTVLGMMRAFSTISSQKTALLSAVDISGDIRMALITTAAGLCVAIPCYVAYNYLIGRVQAMTLDMEKASSEIIYYFKHRNSNRDSDK
jgi:biopolymer transport protein ExbB|eukprot:TRINITY_DN11934_c0_g1_i2.p3 TRINITY_DN11934_c0_g1~~TRINITY_DN11934_c0_g1_i2.p3  ORF type:complete len:213 (-),score=48.33 TRINITY_DN11934_c0_g1_i2:2745-3383(-)